MAAPKTMKAWTHTQGGYPTALTRTTLPLPTTLLKPTEVTISIRAASINPVDAQLMAFPLYPYLPSSILPIHKGVGEDYSGVVTSAGTSSGFAVGDEVFGLVYFLPGGSLQESIRVDTTSKNSVVLPKPPGWSFNQAAAIPLVWLTAKSMIAAVESFMPSKNATIVVLGGASASGMLALHLAKRCDWKVIASCSGRSAELARSFGADEIIDYTTEDVPAAVKAAKADSIIDCVGGTSCVGLAGRYVTIVGDKTSRLSMGGRNTYFWNPQQVVRALRGKLGLGLSYSAINLEFNKAWLREVEGLELDKVVIDSTFDFEDVREGFERVTSGKAKGKVVITFNKLQGGEPPRLK